VEVAVVDGAAVGAGVRADRRRWVGFARRGGRSGTGAERAATGVGEGDASGVIGVGAGDSQHPLVVPAVVVSAETDEVAGPRGVAVLPVAHVVEVADPLPAPGRAAGAVAVLDDGAQAAGDGTSVRPTPMGMPSRS
jgi:hypothetical protein